MFTVYAFPGGSQPPRRMQNPWLLKISEDNKAESAVSFRSTTLSIIFGLD